MAFSKRNHNHNANADQDHLEHEFHSLSLHSTPPKNKDLVTTYPTIPATIATSAGARPLYYYIPEDLEQEGAVCYPNSPLSRTRPYQAESECQQHLPLANTARYAAARPATFLRSISEPESTKKQPLARKIPRANASSASSQTTNPPKTPIEEETRSKPIPIAVSRKKPKHTGLTPLSGRPPSTFPADRFLSSHNRSRTPSPSPSFHTKYSTPISPLFLDEPPYKMSLRPSQPSPLSPTATTRPITIPHHYENMSAEDQSKNQPKPQPRSRPVAQSLNLTGLPKYHPANFPTSGDNTPLSPRSIQALNSSKRNARPGSDAQHALHKYQREIVTRASGLLELAKPTSPRLIPEGSPAGSMTPLALEAQGDYLLARSNVLANTADARRIVDQMLQKENEQRDHPEARRSGSESPAITPPV